MREGLAGCPKVVYHRLRRALYFCRFCQDAFCRLRMKTSVVTQICHNDGAPPCSDHVEHQGLRRRLRGRRARRGVRVLVHALRGKGEAESGERRADVLAPEPRRTTRRRPRPRRPEQPRGVRWRASAALPAAGIRAATLPSAPASATAAEFRRHGSSRAVAVPANLESPASLGRSESQSFTHPFFSRRRRAPRSRGNASRREPRARC